jgi:hypothetical protein
VPPEDDLEASQSTPFIGVAMNPDTSKLCEYNALAQLLIGEQWKRAFCIKWGRLFQGYQAQDPKYSVTQPMNTCQLIRPGDMPRGKKATYIRIVADYREQKADPYRVQCTMGGNLINFPGDKSTRSADLVTSKCLINNIISTPGARAACTDIKDFYLNNPLPHSEYARFWQEDIPDEIWIQYNLAQWVTDDGYIYARMDKGMYGLPQAGKVASDAFIPCLNQAGYYKTGIIPGPAPFKHKTNSIIFALVVDDFLVQYFSLDDFHHLANTLRKHYTNTCDMEAQKWCGITLEWNYDEGHVTLSIPGYIEETITHFAHPTPTKPQHSPHRWTPPNYGAAIQYVEAEDMSPPLDNHGTHRLRQVRPPSNVKLRTWEFP